MRQAAGHARRRCRGTGRTAAAGRQEHLGGGLGGAREGTRRGVEMLWVESGVIVRLRLGAGGAAAGREVRGRGRRSRLG